MNKFQRDQPVYFSRVITITFQMSVNDCSHSLSIDVRPRERARIEEHIPDVARQLIAIPHSEVK